MAQNKRYRRNTQTKDQRLRVLPFFPEEPPFAKGCHRPNKKCVGGLVDRKVGLAFIVEFEPASYEHPEASALRHLLVFGTGCNSVF
jgi:hypothetical protein